MCVDAKELHHYAGPSPEAAQARSEYLVTVFDIQDVPGSPSVLVMEFIPGETL